MRVRACRVELPPCDLATELQDSLVHLQPEGDPTTHPVQTQESDVTCRPSYLCFHLPSGSVFLFSLPVYPVFLYGSRPSLSLPFCLHLFVPPSLLFRFSQSRSVVEEVLVLRSWK